MPDRFDFLTEEQQGDLISMLNESYGGISAFTAPGEIYERPGIEQFREQAETEAAPFFDENLRLLTKQIDQLKEHQREQKQFQEKFQAEEEEQFFRTEDKDFARQLGRAQGRFAGAGTFTSGFRQRANRELREARAEDLEAARRGFREATEGRELGFERFLKRGELQQEVGELDIERERQQDIQRRQFQLKEEEIIEKKDIDITAGAGWRRFLEELAA